MSGSFEQFPVYKKSKDIVCKIELLCRKITGKEFYFIKDQIRRAAASLVLNIAEGSGKWTKKDKANFYRISRGSAFECIAALDLFLLYKLCNKEDTELLKNDFNKIVGELQALIKSVEGREK